MSRKNASKTMFFCFIMSLSVLLASCGGGGGSNGGGNGGGSPTIAAVSRGDLVSNSALTTVTQAQAQTTMTSLNFTGLTAAYGVNAYKVTYNTVDASGNPVIASGLIAVPQKAGGATSPLLSLQHGTITLDSDAPSNSPFDGTSNGDIGVAVASLGYVVVMPDYLGYGAANGMLHPYVHAGTLASATIDMIRAASKFLQQNGVATNGKLFLAGYSEGGYATLAAQKEIETNLSAEFNITASEPGAGPYDMSATASAILASSSIPVPSYVAFVLKAYDTLYNNPSDISAYFQPAYVNAVNTDFDGTKDYTAIDADLGGEPASTSALFNPAFLSGYKGSGETALKADVAKNDIYDWAPKAPTRLFHGNNDTIVPYSNSTTALNAMQANGSTSVTLITCTTGAADHVDCMVPYMLDTKSYFDTMTPGL